MATHGGRDGLTYEYPLVRVNPIPDGFLHLFYDLLLDQLLY